MRGYTCDQCGAASSGEPRVALKGISRKSGILIPAFFQEFVFCGDTCFWRFTIEQMPAAQKTPETGGMVKQ